MSESYPRTSMLYMSEHVVRGQEQQVEQKSYGRQLTVKWDVRTGEHQSTI